MRSLRKLSVGALPVVLRRSVAKATWALSDSLDRIRGRDPTGLRAEERRLERVWGGYPLDTLDEYLVCGYQNPRINVQSILSRHFLIERIFGPIFGPRMTEELRFAIEMNEALRSRARELGVAMGSYVDPAKRADVRRVCEVIAEREADMERGWQMDLNGRVADRVSVIEFACGSANDYRAFHAYGLAPFLEYVGVDLSADNVRNARSRFPDVPFEVGSILDLPYADGGFDYVLASDVFEHLSLGAMERAIAEAARLARRGVFLNFFSMSSQPEHEERPVRSYYVNLLSAPRIRTTLSEWFSRVTVTHIPSLLRERFAYPHSYNSKAYTIVAERKVGAPAAAG